MNQEPLISCLCVTTNTSKLLHRAIDCFFAQTYSNKELVLVYGNEDISAKEVAQSVVGDNIIHVEVNSKDKLSLGELRNISISKSNGTYFCIWDDDDWYNKDRLAVQMNSIRQSQKDVSVLINIMMYDMSSNQAYFSFHKMWENSILCRKSVVSENLCYPKLNKSEDTDFVNKLLFKNFIYPTVLPTMYIYVYHGNNTWDSDHFNRLFSSCQKLSDDTSKIIGEILKGKYSHEESSSLLSEKKLLDEINYFHSYVKY